MRQLTDEHSTTASVVLKTAEQRLKSTTTVMMEKTYIFWIVIIVMYVVSIVNFIMIICIWNIIGYNENPRILNTSPDNGSVLFTKPTECPTVYKEDGEILSFREQPLHVISNQQMTIRVKDKRGVIRDKFTMAADDGSIAFDGLKRFNVIMDSLGTTDTRRNVFDANVKTLDLSTTNLSILDVDRSSITDFTTNQPVGFVASGEIGQTDSYTRQSRHRNSRTRIKFDSGRRYTFGKYQQQPIPVRKGRQFRHEKFTDSSVRS